MPHMRHTIRQKQILLHTTQSEVIISHRHACGLKAVGMKPEDALFLMHLPVLFLVQDLLLHLIHDSKRHNQK